MKFHLSSFLRRVRIHDEEFDSSARAMNRVNGKGSLMSYERAFAVQADTRIVRGSTIERKQMSTKTTFKRIALVAVAALGFGVLSVVPSSATVSALTVSAATAGTAGAVGAASDSSTASTFSVSALFDAGLADTVTVSFVQNGAYPATAQVNPRLTILETTTANTSQVDNSIPQLTAFTNTFVATESVSAGTGLYSISNTTVGYAGAKFGIFLESATSLTRPAGAYNFTIIVKQYNNGGLPVTTTYPATITVAAVAVVVQVAAAANATAYIQNGDASYPTGVVLADSVTAGSFLAGTRVGSLQVSSKSATNVLANDTITVSMTGVGYLTTVAPSTVVTGRSFTVTNESVTTMNIFSDGTSGTGTITITTAKGASFVKTVTFFDTKPVKAVTTVVKAFIKAGTGSVADVFATTVTDTLGNAITNTGAVVTAAPTDTTTTVGGAATCAWNVAGAAYHCAVVGLSALKFGPVAYTITATGTGVNALVKVTTSATVTFADNVATQAVLAGPATGNPGATVEYTLTLTEKNGYPVADQTYGLNGLGGALFSTTAADTVASGFTLSPFSSSESYTSKSGVITSKGTLPIAGVASLSLTLIGDGLQTLTTSGIDKAIGKTKLTVTTEVSNPGVDAATDAANDALDAANAATEAALSAAEAADAATTAAQEASDAVAALSESVTKLIAELQAQIKSLAAVVAKIARKVKA